MLPPISDFAKIKMIKIKGFPNNKYGKKNSPTLFSDIYMSLNIT